MTNQPPLNPDGVLNAMDTLMAETDADERATEWAHKVTTRVLEGYFAVAQPEVQANSKPNQNFEVVNNVEELEALPAQSVIEDVDGCIFEIIHNGERNRDGTFYREYVMTGDVHSYSIDEIDLPATVLKRAPETPRR